MLHELKATREGRIDVLAEIRSEEYKSGKRRILQLLQQITHFKVGITIDTLFDFATPAEQRVRLVEEKDRSHLVRFPEHTIELLFSYAHPLRHYLAQLHLHQWRIELGCDDFSRQGLTRAGISAEQC